MPFCPKCGYELDENAQFCFKCGTNIKKSTDGRLQPQNIAPQNRNAGKIAAIQSKIDSWKNTKKLTYFMSILLMFITATAYALRISNSLSYILGVIGVILGFLGWLWTGREINRLEDEMSKL